MKKDYSKILEKCAVIAKDRQLQYGEASESMKQATDILKDTFGVKLTPKQLCYTIIAIKLSRQKFQFKEDSMIDIINYIAISLICE